MTRSLPSIAEAKAQAKRLRAELGTDGTEISHSRSLELVAQQLGFRDWNTLHAAIGNRPPEGFTAGGRVSGRYLGQPFDATIKAVHLLDGGWARLELDLDQAVDVVTFESFSNFRKRIRATVGPNGISQEHTSEGVPHLALDL